MKWKSIYVYGNSQARFAFWEGDVVNCVKLGEDERGKKYGVSVIQLKTEAEVKWGVGRSALKDFLAL